MLYSKSYGIPWLIAGPPGCVLPPRILPRSRPIAEGFSRRVGGCQCGSPSGRGPRVLMGRDIDNSWHGTQSSYGPGAGIPNLPAQQSSSLPVFSGMVGIIGIKQEKDSTWQKAKAPLARPSRMISPKPSSEPTASTQSYLRHLKTTATHLSNPKRVIEALILHWLDADKDGRAAMAHKHRERIGSASRDDE